MRIICARTKMKTYCRGTFFDTNHLLAHTTALDRQLRLFPDIAPSVEEACDAMSTRMDVDWSGRYAVCTQKRRRDYWVLYVLSSEWVQRALKRRPFLWQAASETVPWNIIIFIESIVRRGGNCVPYHHQSEEDVIHSSSGMMMDMAGWQEWAP